MGDKNADAENDEGTCYCWTSNTRVLVSIIVALLLTIWFTLLLQYY